MLIQVFILGFGNIGIDLAKRLRPFGVKIIATKRSWTSISKDSCQSNGMYGCKSGTGLGLKCTAYDTISSFFLFFFSGQNGVCDVFVDEKGSHEDIYKLASKADIVVCCLSLNNETVRFVHCVMNNILFAF